MFRLLSSTRGGPTRPSQQLILLQREQRVRIAGRGIGIVLKDLFGAPLRAASNLLVGTGR